MGSSGEFATSGQVRTSPAISVDGIVYFGSDDKKVYALGGQTGEKLWEFETSSQVFSSPSIGPDGMVYFGSNDKKLYAVNGQSGQLIWNFTATGRIDSSPAVGFDGTVYFGSYDQKLYALNGQTGEKLWEFETGYWVESSPSISPDGTVYFGSHDKKLYAIQGSTGPAVSPWPMFGQNSERTGRIIPDSQSTFAFVAGEGDTDNSSFTIDGNELKLNVPADFETKSRYHLRIEGIDISGLKLSKALTISVTNVEEAPTSLAIDSATIVENESAGSVVGSLTLSDPDSVTKVPVLITEGVGEKLWEVELAGKQVSAPAIGQHGMIYATTGVADERLYGIDALTGQILWEQPDGAGSTNIFAGYSAPTVGGDGTVYLGDTSKFARALDGKTGDEIWKFEAPKIFMTSPSLGRNGSLFLGGSDNKLYSLSIDTGEKQWDFEDSAGTLGIWSSAAVGTDGTVYVGGATNKLLAFDPETGAKKWQFDIQYGQARSPAIGPDGTIYVASTNRKLYAVSGETGDLLWSNTYSTVSPSIDFSSNPVLGPDGTVYVGAHDKMVSAFNGQTGDKLWEFETGGIVRSTPALGADGVLYVGSADNKLYALDTADGNKLWEFVAGGPINSSPTLSDDGVLYVGADDKKLYAIQASSGPVRFHLADVWAKCSKFRPSRSA